MIPLDSLKYSVAHTSNLVGYVTHALKNATSEDDPAHVTFKVGNVIGGMQTIEAKLLAELARWCPDAADRNRYSDGRPVRTFFEAEPNFVLSTLWPADPSEPLPEASDVELPSGRIATVTPEPPSTMNVELSGWWRAP